ncbi:O-antigen ligase family protein [Actinocorallia sp. A-T 12471]|uniref:O-antigen ligase family protein n=1 Tax=Actinocorallia sp. A-T 12471 TaxID=3089813 RepID=UPI0029D0FE07|nr:O-antigen ligase family protein [Actinocorallia sp. A-T 12471]MDX6738516.1 O-antigen ligase family protein [Actinocorallia sp. A-T 12471]
MKIFPRPLVVTAAAWWPVVLPLALMLASDYKLRSRAHDQAIGGSADLTVLVEIGIYGAAALFIYFRFGMRPPTRWRGIQLSVAWLWVLYSAMTALWSPYPTMSVVRATQMIITMAVVHVLATRASTIDFHRFAHAFVIVVLLSVGIGIVHPFPRTSLTLDRFNWLYVHPVIAGVYLGLAVLIVTGFIVRHGMRATRLPGGRMWPGWAYGGLLIVLAGALVATGTRGAALGCAVGLAVLLGTVNGPRGRADLVVVGFAAVVLAALAFSEPIRSFAARGESAEKLATLNSRTDLWELAFAAFAKEPLFGHGMGASRGLFLRETGLGGGHNAFVNAMVDLGAVGLLLLCGLLLTLAVSLAGMIRHQWVRADAGLLLAIVVFFVVDGMTTEGLAMPANVSGVWLLVLVAWTAALRRRLLDNGAPWNPSASKAPTFTPPESTATTGAASSSGSAPTAWSRPPDTR